MLHSCSGKGLTDRRFTARKGILAYIETVRGGFLFLLRRMRSHASHHLLILFCAEKVFMSSCATGLVTGSFGALFGRAWNGPGGGGQAKLVGHEPKSVHVALCRHADGLTSIRACRGAELNSRKL